MSAKSELECVANYIMAHVPGEPSCNEGAGKCAVRLLKKYRQALAEIMNDLRMLDDTLPAQVADAHELAWRALG